MSDTKEIVNLLNVFIGLKTTWNNMVKSSAGDSKSVVAKMSDLKDKLERLRTGLIQK